jgi:hypothetical protein
MNLALYLSRVRSSDLLGRIALYVWRLESSRKVWLVLNGARFEEASVRVKIYVQRIGVHAKSTP